MRILITLFEMYHASQRAVAKQPVVGKSRRGVKCGDNNKRIGPTLREFLRQPPRIGDPWPRETRFGSLRAFRSARNERPRRPNERQTRPPPPQQIAALTNGIFCDRGATSSDDNDDDPSRDGDNIPSSESL